MQVAILIFDRLTALDAIGPYEVLRSIPGVDLSFVAVTTGEKRTDSGRLGLTADATLDEIPAPDVIVVPGGRGTREMPADERAVVLDWLRSAHQTSTWTTSVCTGAQLLGEAGILDGLKATTHWLYLERLPGFGAEPTSERVVVQGKVITAAGVSAGIDMALLLTERIAGRDAAEAIQLAIEYDPQPPFHSGSPAKARPEIRDLVAGVAKANGELD